MGPLHVATLTVKRERIPRLYLASIAINSCFPCSDKYESCDCHSHCCLHIGVLCILYVLRHRCALLKEEKVIFHWMAVVGTCP